ncbi:MAG TPA: transcription antitermination factor NusB [Erysipelotrichaceae bacterium]|nr:transcription antitermination factor NusB [Erysipelotrichaceae bacterium]
MKRHENREKAVICIYQYLMMERDIDELIADNFTEEEQADDPYMIQVVHTAKDNIERYAGYIDQVLDGWTYERLGYIEKAIILCGCSEFDQKQIEAAVIIDEYVRLAKKFCDSDSYKLINGVLDRI